MLGIVLPVLNVDPGQGLKCTKLDRAGPKASWPHDHSHACFLLDVQSVSYKQPLTTGSLRGKNAQSICAEQLAQSNCTKRHCTESS